MFSQAPHLLPPRVRVVRWHTTSNLLGLPQPAMADPLEPTATPQEAFALMLHDRVVAAEERICALTAELDRRAPALPPSPEKVTVQHATRGCFFSFLAAPGTWPAYEEEGAQEAAAKRLVAALAQKYDGARGHTSVTFCQAPLAEAGAQHIGTAVAFMNAARAVMGRQREGGELSEAAILAACPKATVVEGVVSSAAPGFTVAWAAAALDEAFGALFMHPDSDTRRDEQGREDSVGQAVWGLVAGHRPSLEEVARCLGEDRPGRPPLVPRGHEHQQGRGRRDVRRGGRGPRQERRRAPGDGHRPEREREPPSAPSAGCP